MTDRTSYPQFADGAHSLVCWPIPARTILGSSAYLIKLHQLLPLPKITGYNLRLRGHGLTLPDLQSSYMRKNFLNRMLYSDMY